MRELDDRSERDQRDIAPALASLEVGKAYPLYTTSKDVCVAKFGEYGLSFHLFLADVSHDELFSLQSGSSIEISMSEIAGVGFFVSQIGAFMFECPFHPCIGVNVGKNDVRRCLSNQMMPLSLLLFNRRNGVLLMARQLWLSENFTDLLCTWIEEQYGSELRKDEVDRIATEVFSVYKSAEIKEQALFHCEV